MPNGPLSRRRFTGKKAIPGIHELSIWSKPSHCCSVACCSSANRMLPQIELLQSIEGADAKELKEMCPSNCFDIEESGKAVVSRPSTCTMCRECIRHGDWGEKVRLSRVRDHFIFSIESTGAIAPEDLFMRALQVLVDKCGNVVDRLNECLDVSSAQALASTNKEHLSHLTRMSTGR
mmetsp:Transcript_25510/g.100782  ORF Transcript_25510/g.100782 Transcript_25510/m.100782 type:complete len:177 (+) Transcript_25510:972-1502(+)